MMLEPNVIPFPAERQAQADGIWRPKFLEERKAWICERRFVNGGALQIETFGARLSAGGDNARFSAAFFLTSEGAHAQCAKLNADG